MMDDDGCWQSPPPRELAPEMACRGAYFKRLFFLFSHLLHRSLKDESLSISSAHHIHSSSPPPPPRCPAEKEMRVTICQGMNIEQSNFKECPRNEKDRFNSGCRVGEVFLEINIRLPNVSSLVSSSCSEEWIQQKDSTFLMFTGNRFRI